jgi:hypothetical protein
MARQPTSLFGHMMQATRQTFLAPVRFIGNAAVQAAERLIPAGAAEMGNALFTGNAYAPPGLTERLVDKGNVHGTGSGQQTAASTAPAVSPPAVQSPIQQTQPLTASTYYTPNTTSPSYNDRLESAAARAPRVNNNARAR